MFLYDTNAKYRFYKKTVRRFFDADAPVPNDNLHIPENVSCNRFHSRQDEVYETDREAK